MAEFEPRGQRASNPQQPTDRMTIDTHDRGEHQTWNRGQTDPENPSDHSRKTSRMRGGMLTIGAPLLGRIKGL